MGRAKRIWYLSPMRAAKVQASLRIRAVSPEPSLLAHTSSESRGTFRQKARSLAPLNGWACAVKMCHDGMLEDTNSLVAAHLLISKIHFDRFNLRRLIHAISIRFKHLNSLGDVWQINLVWLKRIFWLFIKFDLFYFIFIRFITGIKFNSKWRRVAGVHWKWELLQALNNDLIHVARKAVLCNMRTTKAQINLRVRPVWSSFCCSLLRYYLYLLNPKFHQSS